MLAIITVDIADDVVDINDGVTSLREAIFAANIVPGADEIVFAGAVLSGDRTITLFEGELRVTDPLAIRGPASGAAITIDGRSESRIINFESGGELTLSRLVLNHGRVTVDSPANDPFSTLGSGGALRATTAGRVTLRDVTVINSSTAGANADGGGIFVAGSLSVIDSRLAGNRAEGADSEGGGIAVRGPLSMQTTQVSRSRAARGGGVAAFNTVEMFASTLDDNTAFDDGLGAGGGLYAVGYSATLINSTISANAAQVTGTDARANGGGVYANGILTIEFSTVTNNSASSLGIGAEASGGGVHAGDTLDIRSSIVASNFSTEREGDVHAGGTHSFRFSLIGDGDGVALAETLPGIPDGLGNFVGGTTYGPIDPVLGPLANNGGRTLTHAPEYGSPAISTSYPGDPPNAILPVYDQRGAGFPRRVGLRIDMGAIESDVSSFLVDTLFDESDGDFSPGDVSLREAMELATASAGGDIIEFAPSLFAAGAQNLLLTKGELRSTGSIDIRGPGASLLTIDASENDSTPEVDDQRGSRLLVLNGTPSLSSAIVRGLRLTGADASGGGGGIASAMDLTLLGVEIVGNFASTSSGLAVTGSLTMIESRVADNVGLNGSTVNVAAGNFSATFILRSVIENNRNLNTRAGTGGINVSSEQTSGAFASEFVMWNSVVSGNTGANASGIRLIGITTADIANSTISDNQSLLSGGGVVAGPSINMSVVDSTISGNRGASTGGISVTGSFDMRNSSVVNNIGGTLSGGIRIGAIGSAVIEQSTISGNHSVSGVGGISSEAPLSIRHSSIVNNVTETGAIGGIGGQALMALSHSIVAGNMRAVTVPNDLGNPVPSLIQFSLIGSNDSTLLIEAPVGSSDALGNLIGGPVHGVIDPLLGPLADNGGPTLPGGAKLLTHKPLAGSPVIDAGDAALEPGVGATPEFDQRGAPFSRVVGARIDMGAVEAIGAPIVVDTLVDESDRDFTKGDLSLREAIELANAQPGADEIAFDPALFVSGPGTISISLGESRISDALKITGPGSQLLILDAAAPSQNSVTGNDRRIFNVDDGIASTRVLVAISGMSLANAGVVGNGGAVKSSESLLITDIHFRNNTASGESWPQGGAIFSSGSLTVRSSSFEKNHAASGGAIAIDAGVAEFVDDVVIEDSSFSTNTSYGGGALLVRAIKGTSVAINRTVFWANSGSAGAIYASVYDQGKLTITSSSFVKNFGGWDGGAIEASISGKGQLDIAKCVFDGNRAYAAGGALDISVGGSATAHVIDSVVSGNSASLGNGGGVNVTLSRQATDQAKFVMRGVELARNYGRSGGGVSVSSEGGVTELTECFIHDNFGEFFGGGLAVGIGAGISGGAPRFSLVSSSMSGNTAGQRGGGAFVRADQGPIPPTVLLEQSSIVGNTSLLDGGGLAVDGNSSNGVVLLQTTISENSARVHGGGIWSSTKVLAQFSTIASNWADADSNGSGRAGGIFGPNSGTRRVTLYQSIVGSNHRGAPSEVQVADDTFGMIEAAYSLVEVSDRAILATPGSPNLIGLDPLLGPLADNCGPTLPGGAKLLTHAPLAGSPVIDAGDPAAMPGVGGVPEFDQRGAPYSRLVGSRVDIGAVESQAAGGALAADFDFDGFVNGNDFLVWQRGLGRTGVVTIRHGDATADGDVDANDLAVWKARAFEAVSGQLLAVSKSGGENSAAVRAADAVYAAGDFSGLFAVSETPSAGRGRWRSVRRG